MQRRHSFLLKNAINCPSRKIIEKFSSRLNVWWIWRLNLPLYVSQNLLCDFSFFANLSNIRRKRTLRFREFSRIFKQRKKVIHQAFVDVVVKWRLQSSNSLQFHWKKLFNACTDKLQYFREENCLYFPIRFYCKLRNMKTFYNEINDVFRSKNFLHI